MKVIVTHVGTMNHEHTITWPEGWPIPGVGDEVRIPDLPEVKQVRVVEWCPEGVSTWGPALSEEPFVYIVVGPFRP